MDFRRIETFLTVANTGKFVTAAEALFISQSSLSKQMSQLESELGVKLFNKTRNGVELTEAGRDFYAYARKALPEFQHEISRLKMYRNDSTSAFTIGSLPLCEEYGFFNSFASFWVRHISTNIQFVERNQLDLLDKLKRHKIDIALARCDFLDDAWFSYRPVVADDLVLVCPANHPLAQQPFIRIMDLQNESFLLLEKQSEITRMFVDICEKEGFHPNIKLTHSRHLMLLKAIERRMGISVLSRRLTGCISTRGLTCIPFEQALASTIGFIWLKDVQPSPQVNQFMDFVYKDFNRTVSREQ